VFVLECYGVCRHSLSCVDNSGYVVMTGEWHPAIMWKYFSLTTQYLRNLQSLWKWLICGESTCIYCWRFWNLRNMYQWCCCCCRQSYDVELNVAVPGTTMKSCNVLDLKNPFFRYTGQQPQPPPGNNHTSPSEAYWNQHDLTGNVVLILRLS